MIGDFIIKGYLESKLRILHGEGTELDRMNVELIEVTLGVSNDEYDIRAMCEIIPVPKLEANIPETRGKL